jgi:hypothetical protein
MSQDYSDVKWPWEDDPNWDAPREGATSNPGDHDNWILQCAECALTNIGAHWQGHYPDWTEENEEPPINLNLVWVGLGAPPQPPDSITG